MWASKSNYPYISIFAWFKKFCAILKWPCQMTKINAQIVGLKIFDILPLKFFMQPIQCKVGIQCRYVEQ